MKSIVILACAVLLLSACSGLGPRGAAAGKPSSAGVWSSALGYHGPVSSMDMAGGPN